MKKLQNYLWLALLLHLLVFLSFSISFIFEFVPEMDADKKADKYMPAYIFQEKSEKAQSNPLHTTQNSNPTELKNTLANKIPINKTSEEKTPSPPSKNPNTSAYMRPQESTSEKPIDEPLLKELSKATAAKLFYPSEARAFRLTGTATIRFLLHPDGQVTEVTLIRSSGFRILDDAAISAIQAISPVRDANLYLREARYIVAGIIYG